MSENAAGRWLVIAAGVVVVATIIAAIAAMGLPSTQRELRLDQRRVQDLQRIADAIDAYVERHGTLPPDLATLAHRPGQRLSIVDPVDHARYGYQVTGAREFRLCAEFTTDTARGPEHGGTADEWLHAAGRQCFPRQPKEDDRND